MILYYTREVASQVIASSAYGMTQIEEEAKMRRKEDNSKRKKILDENGAADDGDKNRWRELYR